MGKYYIGCSGYNYPHWRKGVFYPEGLPQKEEFAFYASIFNTVEINSTFYGLPSLSTWKKWQRRAPKNFLYAVKVSKFLTHNAKLLHPESYWYKFWQGAQKLSEHLGPILFQLPPKFAKNKNRLENLAKVLPKNLPCAFEFRDPSWFDQEIYKVLAKNNWALVAASHPKLPWIEKITANFVYFRFHGTPFLYSSDYPKGKLQKYAALIRKCLQKDLDVYAYFNNDAEGHAPKNALALADLVKRS